MLMTLNNYIRNSNLPMGYQSKHIEIRENLNMKHYALSLTSLLLILLATHLPAANGAETNPKVTAALAWLTAPRQTRKLPQRLPGRYPKMSVVNNPRLQKAAAIAMKTSADSRFNAHTASIPTR